MSFKREWIVICILVVVATGPVLISTQQEPEYCSWRDRHWPEKACKEVPGDLALCNDGEIAACCNEKLACARYKCGDPEFHYRRDCPWTNYYLACCPKYW